MSEVEHLITQALEGTLDANEREDLMQRAKSDPALLAKLNEHSQLHALLSLMDEDPAEADAWTRKIVSAVENQDEDLFVEGVRSKIIRHRFWKASSLAAACLAIAVTWLVLTPQQVATVTSVDGTESGPDIQAGMTLKKGDDITFASGLIELQLGNQGSMIVEGPAKMTFTGKSSLSLDYGRIHMRVTPEGHGYRVNTTEGNIIDLGTEFGVLVDKDSGEVETHVLKGEVKTVSGNDGEIVHLKTNEALRQHKGTRTRLPADPGNFYASLPPSHSGAVNVQHWPLDGSADKPSRLQLYPEGADHFVEGIFGNAMRFDGEESYAESDFPGIGGSKPRTVAFWVRVPSDFNPKQGFAMVSWGQFKPKTRGSVWQISINPIDEDGPIGRLRVGVHGGKAIGSRDLRDDQWHHVAVVLYPAHKPNLGQHVMLFIDGEMEPISRRVMGKIDTNIEGAKHGIWLGRNITSTSEHPSNYPLFRGELDEVYVMDAALSHNEISKLMQRNQPPE